MREALEQIARLAAGAGLGRVSFGVSDPAFGALRDAGGRVRVTAYIDPKEPPYVIESAELIVAGVELHAQARHRAATPEEIAGDDGWRDETHSYAARSL